MSSRVHTRLSTLVRMGQDGRRSPSFRGVLPCVCICKIYEEISNTQDQNKGSSIFLIQTLQQIFNDGSLTWRYLWKEN